jgi:exodeoxyribonuclease VII small subunit
MAKRTQTPPKSFEDALRELEEILGEIENGELGLEESLVKYERGNFLILHCRGVLTSAEKQIELLSRSADGGLGSEPLAEAQRGAGAEAGGEAGDDERAEG